LRVVSTTANTGGKVTLYENTSGCWEISAPNGANASLTLKDIYNNAERLRIDSSGNVGIGTASPLTRLDVRGTGYVSTLNVNYGIGTNGNGIINGGTSLYLRPQGGALRNDTGDTYLTGGNLGIGTESPANLLEVKGTAGTTAIIISDLKGSAGTNARLQFGLSNGSFFTTDAARIESSISAANESQLVFKTYHGSLLTDMTITGGKVMIGTTSPASNNPLTVFDSINAGISLLNSTNHARIAQNGNDVYFDMGAGGTAGSLIFRRSSGNTESLRIASDGQIGIGGANYGTSGQVLTSAGASTAPSWTTISTTPADGSITASKLSGAQTGSAPIYGARAWVNFNGTLTSGQIRASGNVSTITDLTLSQFRINFTTAMPDANYAVAACSGGNGSLSDSSVGIAHIRHYAAASGTPLLVGSVAIHTGYTDNANRDDVITTVTIFR
jgi:hypothetical protein